MKKSASRWLLLLLAGACTPDVSTEQTAHSPVSAPAMPAAAPAPTDTLATYSWDEEVCRYSGRYDVRRYTRQQLADTQELLARSGPLLTTESTPFQPDDIPNLSLDTLAAEYTNVRTRIQGLQLVPGATWQELRRLRLQQLEDEYRAKKLTITGFTNPSVLLNSKYSPACKEHVRGLASGNDSLTRQAWQQLVEEQKNHNGNPQHLQAQFEQQAAAPNWRQYAQADLIGFGWWNCINTTIRYVETTEKMRQHYQQLFASVQTVECADVD
ncbi:hypothetical protein [Hymenobacter weizhouensis]|uniref:hypothetical protein n=1 Tax=Hymenobacter sp. YIM 151500-1 TaxID=2987689 RepID=UPI0022274E4B|nr:hypothetical protein [Hymenobacter sp. YIM 151500-1]UYZ63904.1 hypothetical protein OIS53_03445 [Hymenobacter sp. YIM 151500-1]